MVLHLLHLLYAYRDNDIRIIGGPVLCLFLVITFLGMDWVTRVQKALLVLLIAAQCDMFIGSFLDLEWGTCYVQKDTAGEWHIELHTNLFKFHFSMKLRFQLYYNVMSYDIYHSDCRQHQEDDPGPAACIRLHGLEPRNRQGQPEP